jgi:hypothetical protein
MPRGWATNAAEAFQENMNRLQEMTYKNVVQDNSQILLSTYSLKALHTDQRDMVSHTFHVISKYHA